MGHRSWERDLEIGYIMQVNTGSNSSSSNRSRNGAKITEALRKEWSRLVAYGSSIDLANKHVKNGLGSWKGRVATYLGRALRSFL